VNAETATGDPNVIVLREGTDGWTANCPSCERQIAASDLKSEAREQVDGHLSRHYPRPMIVVERPLPADVGVLIHDAAMYGWSVEVTHSHDANGKRVTVELNSGDLGYHLWFGQRSFGGPLILFGMFDAEGQADALHKINRFMYANRAPKALAA